MLKIGNIELKNRIVMAPMAGISDPAYIRICEEMGVAYAVTELISSEAIVRNNQKTFDMLKGIEDINIPVAIQIFGSDANVMANAAKILTNIYKNIIIDINMGCPVLKVAVKSKAGSALLKDPEKVYEIVNKVVNSVNVPVTVKIRSGWDENNINAVSIAKIIENAGASAICVHGRTRKQGYSGSVDLDIIKKVKENVSIPVIGNGDIKDTSSALKMIEYTNCDAIMIGRALMGNPWLIKDLLNYKNGLKSYNVSIDEKINMIKKHFKLLKKYKTEKVALLEIRAHSQWYLKGIQNGAIIRQEICKCQNEKEFMSVLDNIK